jgi:hypothetical protein
MKKSELRALIREEILNESPTLKDLEQLKGKTIKKVNYDPYIGIFTLSFTDQTTAELGTTGFSISDGDELYIEIN